MSLKIKNYSVKIEDLNRKILNEANLEINKGEIFVLVGHNGVGKSSFAMSLIGIPVYERTGSVFIGDTDTVNLNIDEIAKTGLFVSFQSPPEIEGLTLFDFINTAYRSIYGDNGLSSFKLRKKIIDSAKAVGLDESFLARSTNQGFSGGERRKSEVLQMLVLEPEIAVLDEVDSGLDIESTGNVAKLLRNFATENQKSLLIISHSPEFIKKLSPDKIIELKEQKFIETTFSNIDKHNNKT
jgi:Fe-S cluster assembly ATP-binding protein